MFIGAAGLNIPADPESPIRHVQDMFRVLQEANVTVNVFDPAGLRTAAPSASEPTPSGTAARIARTVQDWSELRALAENTGGRAFLDTNVPESYVPELFQQNSAYYLLGFRAANPRRDGRFRRIDVRVNRPGLTVRTRSGYFAPGRNDRRTSRVPARPLDGRLSRSSPAVIASPIPRTPRGRRAPY